MPWSCALGVRPQGIGRAHYVPSCPYMPPLHKLYTIAIDGKSIGVGRCGELVHISTHSQPSIYSTQILKIILWGVSIGIKSASCAYAASVGRPEGLSGAKFQPSEIMMAMTSPSWSDTASDLKTLKGLEKIQALKDLCKINLKVASESDSDDAPSDDKDDNPPSSQEDDDPIPDSDEHKWDSLNPPKKTGKELSKALIWASKDRHQLFHLKYLIFPKVDYHRWIIHQEHQ